MNRYLQSRHLLLLPVLALLAAGLAQISVARAQYLPVWNQWMDHGLSWNPAYAGSHDAVSLSAFYRRQWLEFSDGPSTASVVVHAPLWNQHLALGTELTTDALGPLQRHALQGHFAWRNPVPGGSFSLGINAGAHLEEGNYASLDAGLDGDPAFDLALEDRWDWNAGAGAYFYNSWLMAGISAMDLAGDRQYFAATSALIRYGDGYGLKPGGFLRYPETGVPQAELSFQFLFAESFWAGANYRSNGDLVFTMLYRQRMATALGFSEWGVGYNYQLPGPQFRNQLGASHEVQISYRFNKDKSTEMGPRFF